MLRYRYDSLANGLVLDNSGRWVLYQAAVSRITELEKELKTLREAHHIVNNVHAADQLKIENLRQQLTTKCIWLFTDKNLPDKECLCWIAFKIGNGSWIKADTCWYKPNIGWQCDEEMEIIAYIEIKNIPEFP